MRGSVVRAIAVHSPFSGELVGTAPMSSSAEVVEALESGRRVCQPAFASRALATVVRGRPTASARRWMSCPMLISRESGLFAPGHQGTRWREPSTCSASAAIEALRDDGEAFAGDVSPNGRARRAHTLRVPVGLVAAITPFNHPLEPGRAQARAGDRRGRADRAQAIRAHPAQRDPARRTLLDDRDPPAAAQIVCGEPAAILEEFLAHGGVEVVLVHGRRRRRASRSRNDSATAAPVPRAGWQRPDARARRRRPRRGRRAAVDGAFRNSGSALDRRRQSGSSP